MSRERAFFLFALALFMGLAAYQLTLPGLHYDEAFEAVPAMRLLLRQPVTTFRGNGLLLGGRLFPLMTQDYIGAINTYAAIPFFRLLGINLVSLRVMAIAIGLVTLCLTHRLARELYGPTAAGLATLLLAVNPTFVFWSRQGVFVTSATAAIGLGATLAWLRWWRTGARRHAIAGAFLCGLGLYAKLLFLWLIVALGLAAVIFSRKSGEQAFSRSRIPRSLIVWSGLAFLLGVAPLVVYNLQTGGTLSSIGGNLTTSYYGTNNLAFLPNLLERLNQFDAVLAGSHFWYLGGTYANRVSVGLFLAALVGTLWLAAGPARDEARRVLFPFVVIGGVILVSCATVSALWVTHFAILAPWPPLAIAAAVDLFVRRGVHRLNIPASPPKGGILPGSPPFGGSGGLSGRVRGYPLALIVVWTLVGAAWVGDIFTDVRYHRALAVSGGLGAHSDAIEDLARWLAAGERRGVPVAAMDWGIAAPVTFLTRGAVTPVEAFGYAWETDADFAARLSRFIHDPASIYLWRAPDEIIFNRSADFKRLYQPLDLEEDILEAFYEHSGRPVLGATHLVPRGTAINPPQPLGTPPGGE